MSWVGGFFGLLAILLGACAPLPQRAGIPAHWQPSPNFDERRPNFVIIHHSGDDTLGQALRTLTDPERRVSAHYLIGRDGTIYQLVDERARAWHAGQSLWGSDSDLNSASLGIELDNNGQEPFPDRQISALLALLRDIKERYHIPTANFLGHADITPSRKVDPSHYFPWKTLADHGFGLWCDAPLPEPPTPIDTTAALQALGYDVSDVEAAIRAFKRHFAQEASSSVLTDRDRALLSCLLVQKADSEISTRRGER
jgi:N-acetylmuramoyl-L-alanine amidase